MAIAILVGIKWHLIVGLIHISLKTNVVEQLLMCSLDIYIPLCRDSRSLPIF